MSEFIETIFLIEKKKDLPIGGGCISCKVLKYCGVQDSTKCSWRKTTCDNEMISICLECELNKRDIMGTIINGRGCD